MIGLLLLAASTATAAPPPQPSAHEILLGAAHAIRVQRLDQASHMASRAIQAGAAGAELDKVLADLAYASGKYPEALARYTALLKQTAADPVLLEHAGIAALKTDQIDRASSLLAQATAMPKAGWRAWNGLGVVSDLRSNWQEADHCYAQASALAPDEPEPVNNQGWSQLLRGNWSKAATLFERAVELDPKSERARNNLELARAALASDLPARLHNEETSAWAARLNDAGVAAAILGDKRRATAAFTQALNASGTWYQRAANNLEALGGR